jgi:hypothetical protein
MVYAVCTSGLGNRIASLIGGAYWSKILRTPLKIVWSPNKECDCSFVDLFEAYHEVICLDEFEREIKANNNLIVAGFKQQAEIIQQQTILHSNSSQPSAQAFFNLIDPNNLNESVLKDKTLVYNNIIVPNYINTTDILDVLSSLKIKQFILNKVNLFTNTFNINKKTKGLLLRKTDAQFIFKHLSEAKYLELLKTDYKTKFFVTSDDRITEQTYKKLSNVLTYPKLSYVEFNKNTGEVYRSKQSVIEGFISMLILSRTTILPIDNSESSFYKTAIMYQDVDFK